VAAGHAGTRRPGAAGTEPRGEGGAIPDCLQLLARAIQQYRTYPANSPLCRAAIESAHQAIRQLSEDGLAFRVTPRQVLAGDQPVAGSLIEQEIARRLNAASIAEVTIDRAVSLRELSHFAADLVACSLQPQGDSRLVDRLAEHGVDHITLRPAYRPEVLPVAAPSEAVSQFLAVERERRAQHLTAGGHAAHLYPPEKGWVCVDPSTTLPSVSLIDLALLADDPADLARMLVRLTNDDDVDDSDRGAALTQKFSDVSRLFSALDPRLARVMFSKLARAVLDLESDRRQALLRRTILLSLLDRGVDGTVLRDFPDVDLAESLCLLLDLETAAPDVVTTALARLELDRERVDAVLPLIDQRLQRRGLERDELSLDAHARRLVRIDHRGSRSFSEFSAFDLSLDEAAEQAVRGVREGLDRADLASDRLSCLWHLIRLEPNPDRVRSYVVRAQPLLLELTRQARWVEVSDWLSRLRDLADASGETRPDVAAVLQVELTALCGPELIAAIVQLADGGEEERATAGRLVASIGAGMGPVLLTAMARDRRSRGIVDLLCEHARLLAPSLAPALGQIDDATDRVIARVFGCAGPGYEDALAGLLASRDEQTVREALRGLARIGTPKAAARVGAELRTRRDRLAAAAEQTLWQFPPAEAQREARACLGRRDFVLARPEVAARLLDRLSQAGTSGMEEMLRATSGLQYRFWNPSLSRLGRKARALLAR
jgi:hypothetical protein